MDLDKYLTIDKELQTIFELEKTVSDSELCVIRLERHLRTVLRQKELLERRGGSRHTLKEFDDNQRSLTCRVEMVRKLYLQSRLALDELFFRYHVKQETGAPL